MASGQTGAVSIVGGKVDLHAAAHTLPAIVVANVPALPSTGCTAGELAIVSSATPGQQIYENSTTGSCTWTQQTASSGGNTTTYGTCTATPSTSGRVNGDLVKCSDSPYEWLLISGSWQLRWSDYNVTAPTVCASLTMINQGGQTTNTCSASGPALVFTSSANSACCQNWWGAVTAPAAPYKLTTRMSFTTTNPGFINAGIGFRNSSSGKAHTLEFYNNTVRVENWSSATGDVGTITTCYPGTPTGGNQIVWTFYIQDDNTNRNYYISGDGVNFQKCYTEARTVDFTADQYIFVQLGWNTNPDIVTWWDLTVQ